MCCDGMCCVGIDVLCCVEFMILYYVELFYFVLCYALFVL